jgi:3-isopropylmalate dehydratase small subunit
VETLPEPVKIVAGKAAPLAADDVDTDQIIPAQFLKVTEKAGLSRYLFYRWRYDDAGTLTRAFVLDRPEFRGSKVLVAGRNFGIGSSRENAVWALLDIGIRCVVASSFGDIFYNNAAKNGLLCVRLPEETLLELRELAGPASLTVTVDLQGQTMSYGGMQVHFDIERHVKNRLMSGLDDIDITTTQYEEAIKRYEAETPTYTHPRKYAPPL